VSTVIAAGVRCRFWVWESIPIYGRLELRARLKQALRKHWDLAYLLDRPVSSSCAVDVGANIGLYSSVLASKYSSVDAFEANPALHRRLQAAAARNVTVWPCGLSDQSASVQVHVPILGGRARYGCGSLTRPHRQGQHDYEVVEARVTRLDTLARSDVTMIKIDVEGHELAVLKGSESLLERCRPTVLVECEDQISEGSVGSLGALMESHGYRGYFSWNYEVLPLEYFEPTEHQPSMDPSSLPSPAYAHMFLFVVDSASAEVSRMRTVVKRFMRMARDG
jgi:FkbM family methyltransferase